MTKREFVNTYCDAVDESRRQKHPDMRPSERAMSRIDDARTADKLWRQHRHDYVLQTVEQFKTELTSK